MKKKKQEKFYSFVGEGHTKKSHEIVTNKRGQERIKYTRASRIKSLVSIDQNEKPFKNDKDLIRYATYLKEKWDVKYVYVLYMGSKIMTVASQVIKHGALYKFKDAVIKIKAVREGKVFYDYEPGCNPGDLNGSPADLDLFLPHIMPVAEEVN